jgi:hypothetical protein
MAARVLSSYRRDDFQNADSYAVQLAMVLERYDDRIIEAVMSPLTGIQRECKFPPSIAEFVEFCDETRRRTNWESEYNKRTAKQFKERDRLERLGKETSVEYRTEVINRVLGPAAADYGFQFKSIGNAAAQVARRQEPEPPYDDGEEKLK